MAAIDRRSLGAVFLSHSSADKPFVRRLERRLKAEGFETWLDEKDLLVGDSLPHEVSTAMGRSKAIVIVISAASAESSWVKFEIAAAAHRMINGQCRLIPVLIDDVEPPAELTGLLYADCRPGRRGGAARVMEALDAEAERAAREQATLESEDSLARSRGSRRLQQEVFDGTGFASMDVSATRTIDWDYVTVEAAGINTDVVVETIVDYGRRAVELSVADWQDWTDFVTNDVGDRFGLLITERAPSRPLSKILTVWAPSVLCAELPSRIHEPSGAMVLVVLDRRISDAEAQERLRRAKEVLSKLIIRQTPAILNSASAKPAAT